MWENMPGLSDGEIVGGNDRGNDEKMMGDTCWNTMNHQSSLDYQYSKGLGVGGLNIVNLCDFSWELHRY